MNRFWALLLGFISWVILVAYLLFSARYCSEQKAQTPCREIKVTVWDSAQLNFITPAMVKSWFETERKDIYQQELNAINTLEIEQFIRQRGFVRDVRVFTSIDGVLHVQLTQRRPVARVATQNGYQFYITDDDYILPVQRHEVVYVPVVTGVLYPPFGKDFVGSLTEIESDDEKKVSKNYEFLANLINFVKFVQEDDFWNAFIVQIDVQGHEKGDQYDPEVRLVPRIGNQLVMLGSLEEYPDKLSRLMSFYRNGAAYEGWDNYRYINLKYRGQVICTN